MTTTMPSIDFGINLTDIVTMAGNVLSQLWPVVALFGGIALGFALFRRLKSALAGGRVR